MQQPGRGFQGGRTSEHRTSIRRLYQKASGQSAGGTGQGQNPAERLRGSARHFGEIEGYEAFITRFSTGDLVQRARVELESLEFTQANRTNSIRAWRTFLSKYPQSTNALAARGSVAQLLLAQAIATNTASAYKALAGEFSGTPAATEALHRLEMLDYAAATNANDIAAYETFLSSYPSSSLAPDARKRLDAQGEERDWNGALLGNESKDYLTYWRKHPNTQRLKILSGDIQIPGYVTMFDNRPCYEISVKGLTNSTIVLDLAEARKWGLTSEGGNMGGAVFFGAGDRVRVGTTLLLVTQKAEANEATRRFRVVGMEPTSRNP